jgi:hypothetical protein
VVTGQRVAASASAGWAAITPSAASSPDAHASSTRPMPRVQAPATHMLAAPTIAPTPVISAVAPQRPPVSTALVNGNYSSHHDRPLGEGGVLGGERRGLVDGLVGGLALGGRLPEEEVELLGADALRLAARAPPPRSLPAQRLRLGRGVCPISSSGGPRAGSDRGQVTAEAAAVSRLAPCSPRPRRSVHALPAAALRARRLRPR